MLLVERARRDQRPAESLERGAIAASAAAAELAGHRPGLIYYNLDTLVGSSGAGVLNDQGQLVGVHSDGDCAKDGSGANLGSTAARIVEASTYLQDIDLGGR